MKSKRERSCRKTWIPEQYKAYNQTQYKEFGKQRLIFTESAMHHLVPLLKYHNQATFGSRIDLSDRVADIAMQGTIERCPECTIGKPVYNLETGKYECQKKVNYLDIPEIPGCGAIFNNLQRGPFKNLDKDELYTLWQRFHDGHVIIDSE